MATRKNSEKTQENGKVNSSNGNDTATGRSKQGKDSTMVEDNGKKHSY